MSGKYLEVCRFYSRGKVCKHGTACYYQHSVRDISAVHCSKKSGISTNTTQPGIGASINIDINISECKNDNQILTKETESCDPQLRGPDKSSEKIKICSYFAKRGWCGFGNRCQYIHKKKEKQSSAEGTSPATTTEEYISPKQDDAHMNNVANNDRKKNEKQVCHFFKRTGHCRNGTKCIFLHAKNPQQHLSQRGKERKDHEDSEGKNVVPQEPHKEKGKTTKLHDKKLCIHFRKGFCRSGQKCRFLHPMDMMEDLRDLGGDHGQCPKSATPVIDAPIEDDGVSIKAGQHQARKSQPARIPFTPIVPKISINRETCSDKELNMLRKTEIEQLQKRFPRNRCTVINNGEDSFECRVLFIPSDPDWPFDVKKFDLLFTIPPAYPQQMLTVTLPLDQDLPETVRRYLEVCVVDWITERSEQLETAGVHEIVFRPFLKWMDRNLETNVTEALRQMRREMVAKVAGFEFINASELQKKYKVSDNASDAENADDETSDQEGQCSDAENADDETSDEDGQCSDDDDEQHSDDDDEQHSDQPEGDVSRAAKLSISIDMETEKKGTEITLKNLQVCNGAATLLFEKVHVVIQCGRCKHRTDFKTPAGRINSIPCSKCNETQLLTFRPSLLHQFNSVLGYLDLSNCSAFDLSIQESTASVGCLNCSKESKLKGFVPGQVSDTWCRHCHQKMRVAADAVHLAHVQPSGVVVDPQRVHQVSVRKLRVQKDPSIQEGKPLPEYGACKHYKKSYRWFRFPCCGMIYPCDVCHEEKCDGHDMVFANRIICGFCCKEQPYAPDKPCVLCLQMTTRGRSTHWEGGSGCRDKIKMSRNDNQKYANMSKTISKHAQKLKENNSSKKKLKLRHA